MSTAAGEARVTLSTSSVYPLGPEAAFEAAARLGYDGIEVMTLANPLTQDAQGLRQLSERFELPIHSIHAPTLLVTQRVYGTSDPWEKIDRSIELAHDVGAEVVVLHPPFRWQKDYAADFVEGVAQRESRLQMPLAVENMFPWRAGRNLQVYLPGWDPVPQSYANVTLDLSHAATSGSDALAMQADLGARLSHVHLADGSGSIKDEHLVPGRGGQPCAEFCRRLGYDGYDGLIAVEVGTRRRTPQQRDEDLAESLELARTNFALGAEQAAAAREA
ncbi:sugar phosphate isomerase/epimerase family protein [Gephyromycinifex aptenodytis]|uniref:sugar phosphate isomerase/epimerase family protein n=1 Tax=Gephyromycinifex aptenodytis TaxID=2716227 RepID=UPI001446D299|nr:sugar phosphate isomerase/epimerase [Gephyromycinifex aptenodytis]